MGLIDNSPRINFARLITRIQPTEGEIKSANSHIDSTKRRLQKSFNLVKFQRIGSHARFSAIKSFSDLDFLAVIARNEAKWGGSVVNSDTVIKRVSQDLNSRFLTTKIGKDKQAVVLQFGGGQKSMDVVPGFFHKFDLKNKRPIYLIPDGSGEWMETSPDAHNSYINKENLRSGGKLKKVGQLLRFWKHSRANVIPISSFYIDLLLAQSEICIGAKSYPEIMCDFFELMYKRRCRGLQDPMGVAGVVYAVKTETQGETLLLQIENSYGHALKAIIAEEKKQFKEANRQWSGVFNGKFI